MKVIHEWKSLNRNEWNHDENQENEDGEDEKLMKMNTDTKDTLW